MGRLESTRVRRGFHFLFLFPGIDGDVPVRSIAIFLVRDVVVPFELQFAGRIIRVGAEACEWPAERFVSIAITGWHGRTPPRQVPRPF
jgi:hypothetical protein